MRLILGIATSVAVLLAPAMFAHPHDHGHHHDHHDHHDHHHHDRHNDHGRHDHHHHHHHDGYNDDYCYYHYCPDYLTMTATNPQQAQQGRQAQQERQHQHRQHRHEQQGRQAQQIGQQLTFTADSVDVLTHDAVRLARRLSAEARTAAASHAHFRGILMNVSDDARVLAHALKSRADRVQVRDIAMNLNRAMMKLEEATHRSRHRGAFAHIERTYRELEAALPR